MNEEKLKPRVKKKYLLLLAGILWLGVGIMLNAIATSWLWDEGLRALFFAVPSIVLAFIIRSKGLARIIEKNRKRIMAMEERPWVFSYMSWKSYLLVALMIAMGITLRHSSIPKDWLSIVYVSMGTALLISSTTYFRHFRKTA